MTKPANVILWTAILVCGLGVSIASAQTFNTVHSFSETDGANPKGMSLSQGADGSLYGTTPFGGGGVAEICELGCGVAFKITLGGTLTDLYIFCSQSNCADGRLPYAGLVAATDGNFYGVTDAGGGPGDNGTVYKITPTGKLTTLYTFCAQPNCLDGSAPQSLLLGVDDNFYGTTSDGGANNFGTVFKITRTGTLTTLYSFCAQAGCRDGENPLGLIQATNGNLYGTTIAGGSNGQGTIFRITRAGVLTTLFSFDLTDNGSPYYSLIEGMDGNFYGTTLGGGANNGGSVFKMSPSGAVTTLYSFCSETNCTDGESPYAPLMQASDDNFYATTYGGGAHGAGTVFKLTRQGSLTTLYSFCEAFNCRDGELPAGGLVQDTNGTLYGSTQDGGNALPGVGTIFSLSIGLGPLVKPFPTAGRVGTGVGILGTDLTGATNVTFNAVPAQFKVRSPTLILTQVPAGATTGQIKVTLPGGILRSTMPFFVLP
jgi:uncharacterized repeat protein (TIGR03803 family)